jgi:hypothetical protein
LSPLVRVTHLPHLVDLTDAMRVTRQAYPTWLAYSTFLTHPADATSWSPHFLILFIRR